MATVAALPRVLEPAPPSSDVLYEVVGSQILEKPPMAAYETGVASQLLLHFALHLHDHPVGRAVVEMLFLLDRERNLKRRPDVAFVSSERHPLQQPIPEDEAWNVIPDLAVEITSRTNTLDDVLEKLEEYFEAGVRRAWVIHPRKLLALVWTSPTSAVSLSADGLLEGADILPAFQVRLADLL